MTLLPTPLVSVQALAERLGDPNLRVFDATVDLYSPPEGGPDVTRSGREGYERGHIPGAAFADILGELSDADASFPFMLPPPDRFARAAGRLGIGPETHVVAYARDSPMWATRLWWELRFFGFDAVSVLDGGLPAWRAAGLPVEAGTASYPPAMFTPQPRTGSVASRSDVEAAVANGDACLVNTLPAADFRGDGPSAYSRPGRIPHSINAPWTSLIDRDTNRFRPLPEIERALDDAGALEGGPVIAYCGSGISATIDLLAFSLVGREDARLYDGSLNEWTHDPALPLEVG